MTQKPPELFKEQVAEVLLNSLEAWKYKTKIQSIKGIIP